MIEEKKKNKYDYNLKDKDDRAEFIENKIGFIFDMPAYMIMGYASDAREGERKFDRIPKMIDAYTTYLLTSRDVESSRKTEYSFFVSKRDEMRRKTNDILFRKSDCFDGGSESENEDSLNHSDTYIDKDNPYGVCVDYGFEDSDSQALKYAIRKNMLSKKDYKKVLSMSADILIESKDEELKSMVEQVVFNCKMHIVNDNDTVILKEFIQGLTLREISDKTGVSFSTVRNRMDKMLEWVAQES